MTTVASKRVWDPLVRVFHWSLVTCVLLNLFVVNDGEDLHQWLGHAAAALVAVRVVWGFIGPRHARFTDFFPTPRRVASHVRALFKDEPEHHWGHNPLGGLMVLGLMGMVLALGLTGWMQGLDAFWGEEWLQDLHKGLGEWLMPMVGLHAAAAIVMGRIERTRLVKAMVTGVKERY
ncbi:cytochrome b/b6 domain-containing protein [Hydrogenophaga sp.]|uniref:cytochrome b/b6 domain-containing protein n=1 Tax=Hydrogenophaga sp. TaxID=1904254 RepID=UPI00272FCAC5|nr:cytochrome b/b6 domain-containing protein [Hydrogenophaga sp.]MDP2018717.1 cytochrome b/b6 domain-containing protein [Hydrogenophaga sp.]MDP3167625.1 cytochrome b/b6 domain-containing protein [Hydrogenophaga sp.]MDP3813390.1 cytochrome b/b6 domain-containing protein [Hydrogenophaga sp.]